MTKYYFDGTYREFRGRVFWNKKPVTITDHVTLDAIKHDPAFKEYREPEPLVEEIHEDPITNPDACPKCGRIVRQGRYAHVKYCEGRT